MYRAAQNGWVKSSGPGTAWTERPETELLMAHFPELLTSSFTGPLYFISVLYLFTHFKVLNFERAVTICRHDPVQCPQRPRVCDAHADGLHAQIGMLCLWEGLQRVVVSADVAA